MSLNYRRDQQSDLRICVVHNYYSSVIPSGENVVCKAEIELLRKHGHNVLEFSRYNDEICDKKVRGSIKAAVGAAWNPFVGKALKREVESHSSNIVHVHNTFPLISPAIFHALRTINVARVLTLHNYRLFCSAAIPMRQGKVCTECLDTRSAYPALRYGCFRDSRLATLPVSFGVSLHRFLGTWDREVDAFIALTDFQKEVMVDAGLPASKVHVKPNFVGDFARVVPWRDRTPYVVFAGRLSEEKGVLSLIEAWRRWGHDAPKLVILGDGPLRDKLRDMADGIPVHFYGNRPFREVQDMISHAYLQILPSEGYEAFGMVVCEAFAAGTPSAVSDIGSLPSIVTNDKNGVVFRPRDPDSLLQVVRSVWETPGKLAALGAAARREYEHKYTEAANYSVLMGIYDKAGQEASKRQKP